MAAPIERVYELALRALDEQERRVEQARASVPPLVATAGIGLSLLAGPAFASDHPRGVLETAAVVVGLGGASLLVACCALLLRAAPLGFAVNAVEVQRAVDHEETFYADAIYSLTRRRRANERVVAGLHGLLDVTLLSLVLELLGLGAAAALAW